MKVFQTAYERKFGRTRKGRCPSGRSLVSVKPFVATAHERAQAHAHAEGDPRGADKACC